MNNEILTQEDTIELSPSYNLPVILILLGIALSLWQTTTGIVITVIGLFLLIQSFIIKLKFTATTLEVCRGQTVIRSFPYSDWQNWEIYFPVVPILFYFKEVKSIHFLPIIFNPQQLQSCLEKYCSGTDNT